MVKYTFHLKPEGSPSESYGYSLDLNDMEEDAPEKVFTPLVREKIRKTLQDLSLSAIRDYQLNRIIQTWTQDIKQGYRFSSLSLNLRLLVDENIDQLEEDGNQEIPQMIAPDISDIQLQSGVLPPLNFV
ncbi:hypothetical protein NIES932_04630 [Raphidiopsis curvata NIES-932]|nr:hypothetical protein NIES932_04630 [Raphidiopsis curvata NIES-932]